MDRIWPDRIEAGLVDAPPSATGVLFVDLAAIRRNYRSLCQAASGAETSGVIKANAYGLGAGPVLSALRAEGCKTFFVAAPGEAQGLPPIAEGEALYVLDGFLKDAAPAFGTGQMRPVLNSLEEIEDWAGACRLWGRKLPAAIHADTGMTRLGLSQDEVESLSQRPEILAALDLRLIMSHLACADQPASAKNEDQRRRFELVAARFPGVPRSLANSSGVFLGQPYHFDLTRPGIALYGGRAGKEKPNPFEPVAFLYGRIAQLRWAERGETVGYNAAYTLKRRTRIVTVTVGYADGFLRALSGSDVRDGPSAFIGPHALPLLGRVSMDLTTYDATDVPDELLKRGGYVEILGERVTVDDLAQFAGTISYEILTSLGRRYHRAYWEGAS